MKSLIKILITSLVLFSSSAIASDLQKAYRSVVCDSTNSMLSMLVDSGYVPLFTGTSSRVDESMSFWVTSENEYLVLVTKKDQSCVTDYGNSLQLIEYKKL